MNKHIQKILIVLFIAFLGTKLSVSAQTETKDFTFKRHFIGSSLFTILNLFPDPADFYQLEYGLLPTRKYFKDEFWYLSQFIGNKRHWEY